MASGEWPSRLKMATLEAGALATKQYAWYYAMKGNHRSHYARNGQCYDVRDDTNDQLYKHYARPDARQKKAVDKTWGLSLRKNGSFFLTGYRAGARARCAADANGWKLYASSVDACAENGWSYMRILKTYLGPNLGFVWSKNVGPNVSTPRITLQVGNNVASGAATVRWQPQPRKAGVSRFQLQRKVAGGAWKTIDLPKPKALEVRRLGQGQRQVPIPHPRQGRQGQLGSVVIQRQAPRCRTRPRRLYHRGRVRGDRRAEAQKIKARFTGRSVALVMRTGPGMGRVRVFIDGKRVGTVDLDRQAVHAAPPGVRQELVQGGSHAIAIKPVSNRERVDFNGFFVLR